MLSGAQGSWLMCVCECRMHKGITLEMVTTWEQGKRSSKWYDRGYHPGDRSDKLPCKRRGPLKDDAVDIISPV